MTDEEILLLANGTFTTAGSSAEFIGFARAIESRTLTKQKANWYQEGLEAEREACARLCDRLYRQETAHAQSYGGGYWLVSAKDCAKKIRARGE